MPKIRINGIDHYYEQTGAGEPVVFIHGAFAEGRVWNPQWRQFSNHYCLLRYDLRGHGRTGVSSANYYTIETFTNDLACLLDALNIQNPVLCGQSFGGSIAMAFAARHPGRARALITAGSMAAIDLTRMDWLLSRVLFPSWAMTAAIKLMSVRKFTHFSLWLGQLTKGKHFLGQEQSTIDYLKQCMMQMDRDEYLKLWAALYRFKRPSLESISCPTLVLNGEHEPKSMLLHTREMLRSIPLAEAAIIPAAHHASNMDNPVEFNRRVDAFLMRWLG